MRRVKERKVRKEGVPVRDRKVKTETKEELSAGGRVFVYDGMKDKKSLVKYWARALLNLCLYKRH